MTEHTKTGTRRHTATPRPDGDASPTYIQLAGDALLAGMTREQAIAGLISRIKRDQGYLAYRRACNRKTTYDDLVRQDLLAFALAAVLLEDSGTARDAHSSGDGQRPPQAQEEAAVRGGSVGSSSLPSPL